VFGARAGRAMRESISGALSEKGEAVPFDAPLAQTAEIRRLAWERCGIVRCGDGLRQAVDRLESYHRDDGAPSRERTTVRNVHQVASLIARSALGREESRGAHFRTDFPEKREPFEKHSVLTKDSGVRFE
jgi:L-aspartate oxidase